MRGTTCVAVVVLVVASTVAMAEVPPLARDAVMTPPAIVTDGPAWGTTALSKFTLSPWDFVPVDSTVTYTYALYPGRLIRTNASGDAFVMAPFHLPTGALMTQVEVQYCDSSATYRFAAWLSQWEIETGDYFPTFLLGSSPAETPGCVIQTATLAPPMTVDNNANFYQIEVNLGNPGDPGDPGIAIGAVRIGYMLQISPAPLTATFTDVPTGYWAFRHIEALAASGITAGCGGGNFCPENYVKRSEMAVYLAKALGLHWPDQTITAPSR